MDRDRDAPEHDAARRHRRRPLDQIAIQIEQHLRETRRMAVRQQLVDRLSAERGVVIHLDPFRLTFDNSRAPAKGPQTAPVTLVEFSDFQCSFCARFAPTLHSLAEEFGDQLRIVYRHFPLTNIHPYAVVAAEASMCAHEQGEFWAMHDLIFAEQNRVTRVDLKEKAGRLGMDRARFDACLESRRYTELVEADAREGQSAGVTGTPALFLNGVPLEGGAVPFEVVAEAVRRELRRLEGRS
jgi:protein-disulfide isomerase